MSTSTTPQGTEALHPALAEIVAKERIRDVLLRYSRGIDRKDWDLVRACYHPDATDDHGGYNGGLDGFITYAAQMVARYTNTAHFLGNMLIEVEGTRAYAESYCIAMHRLPPKPGKLKRDITLVLRYVDVLEERDGDWRIAQRVVTYDWGRLDSDLDGREMLGDDFVRGASFPDDPVYAVRRRTSGGEA